MLYQKKELTNELFKNPTAEYRGTPFWAWNCKMTKENIDYTIDALQAMGMGGGHIHCRTGMDNPYLGEEFMELVQYANEEFKKRNMLTWLYDEDRWPSGAGGGYVTREQKYRIRFLVFSPKRLEGKQYQGSDLSSSGQAVRSENRTLLARYGVTIKSGYLENYRLLTEDQQVTENEKEWFAYLEISGDNPWFNNQAYLNTLDKKAVEKFVEVTHEKYFECLKQEFGKSIPAIFTDEPQFSHKRTFAFATDEKEVTIPYTDDLEETFVKEYGHSLLAGLPELFWELPDQEVSVTRYEYHDHIAERFAEAFADTVGTWCDDHGILLTGHMMEEPTLESQTAALGEAMRSYRSFTLPGVDMLCDWRELSTVKQAQSASHQFHREGVISELYGVTNWDFDFRGHKLQGDWQAALGVTVRVQHLTWTSMAGEAKRDYPAAIGYQSPWYQEYCYIENYFSRLNTILTRGTCKVRIGVIHPIESYWLYWGTQEQTGDIRKEMDNNFNHLIQWLLYGYLDFDFIAESLVSEIENLVERYDVFLVPNCLTLRKTTYGLLEQVLQAGKKVIVAGEMPLYEAAKPSGKGVNLCQKVLHIPFNQKEILSALEPYRELDVRDESGNRTTNIISSIREEEGKQWLFLAHVEKMENPDIPKEERLTITLKGIWKLSQYDALKGTITTLEAEYEGTDTIVKVCFYEHDSFLLEMIPIKAQGMKMQQKTEHEEKHLTNIKLPSEVQVTLSEPNVLVLDLAEYCFDEEAFKPKEEILRIDNLFRTKLGYPLRMEAFAQPWVVGETRESGHKLTLRIPIFSQVEVDNVDLALEDAEEVGVWFNETPISNEIKGWYTDRSIQTISLGKLKKGENELLVTIPYHEKRNIEAMYLLGDFGVCVKGSETILIKSVNTLAFGDITNQGLPFYGGNIIYHLPIETISGDLEIQTSRFRSPVIKAVLDGEEKGYICFSPYRLKIEKVNKGHHRLDLVVYGNRRNTFGTLHNCDWSTKWYGPNSWRTEEESWSYEYQLAETGLLKQPIITEVKK